MASRTSELTEKLVEAITGLSPTSDDQAFKDCRNASLRSLKNHRYGRTNQFSVQSSLHGLVEKFHVLDKESLAVALEERIQELPNFKRNKTLPEMLSLLLLLSDRPAEKSNLRDLELLKAPAVPAPAPTWSEIIGSDDLGEEELWNAPDYASSDEGQPPPLSEASQAAEDSSILEDFPVNAESLVLPVDPDVLVNLKSEHQWRKSGLAEPLTEVTVVREVLHMLQGLPSVLFSKTQRSKKLVPRHDVKLSNTSDIALHSLLAGLADTATAISSLRSFAAKYRKSPLLQMFTAQIQQQIHAFDSFLHQQEKEMIDPSSSVVASLLELEWRVQDEAKLLLIMNDIVIDAQTPSLSASLQSPGKAPTLETQPHRLLDHLYAKTCSVQAIGEKAAFLSLALVFFACLETYLRPIRDWMVLGKLTEDPDFPFALVDLKAKPLLSTFWYDRYEVTRGPNGKALAPAIFHKSIPAIFSSGKSIAFMHELGLQHLSEDAAKSVSNSPITLDQVLSSHILDFLPFEEVFEHHFEAYLSSLHQKTSSVLVKYLLHGDAASGILNTIDALRSIYFSSNGATFDSFAHDLYALITNGIYPPGLAIREIAQRVFEEEPAVNTSQINITVSTSQEPLAKTIVSKRLSQVQFHYTIPLALQNIIPQETTVKAFGAVQIMILQLRYSIFVLRPLAYLPQWHMTMQTLGLNIRHRILHTLVTLEDYILHSVISPAHVLLRQQLLGAVDVDALIAAHEKFVSDVRLGCFEAGKRTDNVRRTITALCDLSLLFAQAIQKAKDSTLHKAQPDSRHPTKDPTGNGGDSQKALAEEMDNERKSEDAHIQAQALARLRHIRTQLSELVPILATQIRSIDQSGTSQISSDGLYKYSEARDMLAERLFHDKSNSEPI